MENSFQTSSGNNNNSVSHASPAQSSANASAVNRQTLMNGTTAVSATSVRMSVTSTNNSSSQQHLNPHAILQSSQLNHQSNSHADQEPSLPNDMTSPPVPIISPSQPQILTLPNGQQVFISQDGAVHLLSMPGVPNQQGQQLVFQSPNGTPVGPSPAAQIIQTADGRTLILQQPDSLSSPQFIQTANGLIQVQPTTSSVQSSPAGQQTIAAASGQPGQNIVMVVPGAAGVPSVQRIPLNGGAGGPLQGISQQSQAPQQPVEEEPLYVNAKQYHRILKRREARARLEQDGRIPKERKKYLHESRHKHAMNRVRGEGGRFHSGSSRRNRASDASNGHLSHNGNSNTSSNGNDSQSGLNQDPGQGNESDGQLMPHDF
jgi:nuclear transcription factor Y alpha